MTKVQVKTAQDLEKYYNNTRLIKFREGSPVPTTVMGAFKRIVTDKEATYTKGNKIQTVKGTFRSLDDVIRLIKFYFNHMTVKEIMTIFVNYYKTDRNYHAFRRCNQINKYNFQSRGYGDRNSFGITTFKYQGFPNCNVAPNDIVG